MLASAEKQDLNDFRAQQLDKFAQRGFPTRKEEPWKYTVIPAFAANLPPAKMLAMPQFASMSNDESIRMVFVNGRFADELSYNPTTEVTLVPLSQMKILFNLFYCANSMSNVIPSLF